MFAVSAKDGGLGMSQCLVDEIWSEVRTEGEFRAEEREGLPGFVPAPVSKEEAS
jgi:hypothetical protein